MKLPSLGLNKLDRYVAKICLGSFAVCVVFILGLFIVGDLISHLERFVGNIDKLQDAKDVPEAYAKLGWFLIVKYYLISLPFSFMRRPECGAQRGSYASPDPTPPDPTPNSVMAEGKTSIEAGSVPSGSPSMSSQTSPGAARASTRIPRTWLTSGWRRCVPR